MAQGLVGAVRGIGADTVVVIGGIQWSKDLSWAVDAPLTGDNIAYAAHIYPGDSASNWDHWFGDFARTHPVLLTEWGFADAPTDAP
ncbi:MAG: glycoside hydrolase family 5 protein [Propionibacteriaceae bacterium]|nr:glycoside hydrolase family 5 protein [Propionibacteriaceae bacterium]